MIGTDANHNLEDKNNFKVFPNNKAVTTRKKRTDMQCQFGKAGKLIEETKDHIISNQPVLSWKIETIKSTEVCKELLPNDNHPYDHFAVIAKIELDKQKYRKMSIPPFDPI